MTLLLLTLLACGPDECEVVTSEVADDAPLGDLPYTAADLLAAVTGSHAIQVDSANAGVVDATFAVQRGEGAARFSDATYIRRFDQDDLPLAPIEYDIKPACLDSVNVPVTLTLSAPAIGVDLSVLATAQPPDWLATPEVLGEVAVSASLPVDTPGLPAPPPDGAIEVFLHALLEGGALQELRVSWWTGMESYDLLRAPVPIPAE